MFYHINGVVTDIEPNLVVLECGGVGYALNASLNTIGSVRTASAPSSIRMSASAKMHMISTALPARAKSTALSCCSASPALDRRRRCRFFRPTRRTGLALAVLNGDEKALTSAPGIGKRIAQRILLELKDKMAKESARPWTLQT